MMIVKIALSTISATIYLVRLVMVLPVGYSGYKGLAPRFELEQKARGVKMSERLSTLSPQAITSARSVVLDQPLTDRDNLMASLDSRYSNRQRQSTQGNRYCPLTGTWSYYSPSDFTYNPRTGFRDGGPPYRASVRITEDTSGNLTVSGFYNMSSGEGVGSRELSSIDVEMPLVAGESRIRASVSDDNQKIEGSIYLGDFFEGEQVYRSHARVSFTMTRQTECDLTDGDLSPTTEDVVGLSDEEAEKLLEELQKRSRREGWQFAIADSRAFRRPIETVAGTEFPQNFAPLLFDVIYILDYLGRTSSLPTDPPLAPITPTQLSLDEIPDRFDAREWNVVPPIRDQGSCGSCWAFASMASYEIAYSALLGRSNFLDLSEQNLLDCNSGGWSCESGFVSEGDEAYRDIQGELGLASEQAYPYLGQQRQCRLLHRSDSNSSFVYQPGAFQFVAQGDPGSAETVNAIKASILAYGSAWVGMYADSDRVLQAYGGGVFGKDGKGCDNEALPNHAVNVVGWNDTEEYWIIRNSWGDDWGESGYLRIEYGCNSVGAHVAVPKTLTLQNCDRGSCQTISPSLPPWIAPSTLPDAPQPNPPATFDDRSPSGEPRQPRNDGQPYRYW